MARAVPRPPFDAELKAGLAVVGGMFPPTITADLIEFMRTSYASPPMDEEFDRRRIAVNDVTFPGVMALPSTLRCFVPGTSAGPVLRCCTRTPED